AAEAVAAVMAGGGDAQAVAACVGRRGPDGEQVEEDGTGRGRGVQRVAWAGGVGGGKQTRHADVRAQAAAQGQALAGGDRDDRWLTGLDGEGVAVLLVEVGVGQRAGAVDLAVEQELEAGRAVGRVAWRGEGWSAAAGAIVAAAADGDVKGLTAG